MLQTLYKHLIYLFLFLSCLFLVVLEFELRDSHLLGSCSTTLATIPALFVLCIFEIRYHFLPGLA
jgi:hypothetical protein